MIKKVLVSLIGALALVLCLVSPAQAADTGSGVEQVESHASLSAESAGILAKLTMRNVRTGALVRPFVDPPGGGCTGPTHLHTIASYTNNVLTSVAADYDAQIVCTATGANQNMAGIVVTVQLWKDAHLRDEGPTVNCVNCLVSPISKDVSACAGVTCAGSWWAGNLHALKAPAGWVWPSAPAGCIGLGTAPYEWIQCSIITGVITITAAK
jgi:hypothetical protein